MAKGARRKGPFATVEAAVEAIRRGEMVIVVDDEDRENEGDLTIAAEKITRKTLTDSDQRRLIDEALAELDFSQLEGPS